VDCRSAEATIESDRVRILHQIEQSPGGIEGLNASIVVAMEGAEISCSFGDAVQAPIENAECDNDMTLLLDETVLPQGVVNAALGAACAGGKSQAVQVLLRERGADPFWRDVSGTTALWRACYLGLMDIVEMLLLGPCSSADNNSVVVVVVPTQAQLNYAPYPDEISASNGRSTALTIAAAGGYVQVVKRLLDAGANVDGVYTQDSIPTTNTANTASSTNINNDNDENVFFIAPENEIWNSPLWLACLTNNIELVDLLVKNGADIHRPAVNGSTPFIVACGKGNVEVVEYLVQNTDVNPTDCDATGKFPLLVSALQGSSKVCELLLKKGAQVDQALPSGHNALYCAVCGNKLEFVSVLLEWCKVNELNCGVNETRVGGGRTPLWEASLNGYDEMTVLLLKAGADIYQSDEDNELAPITLVCWRGHESCLRLLLSKHKANRAMMLLSETTNMNTSTTTSSSIDFNMMENESGLTPLLAAIGGGHVNIVQLLLEEAKDIGLDVARANRNNVTPIFDAREKEQFEIVELLTNYLAATSVTAE
jgi:ankyrin repeat protein